MQTIKIVDPRPRDYADFVAEAVGMGVDCCHFTTAEEALRGAHGVSPSVWLINMVLPDMPGAALMAELKALRTDEQAWLVVDRYSASDEVEARAAGPTGFLCKPARRFTALLGLTNSAGCDWSLPEDQPLLCQPAPLQATGVTPINPHVSFAAFEKR